MYNWEKKEKKGAIGRIISIQQIGSEHIGEPITGFHWNKAGYGMGTTSRGIHNLGDTGLSVGWSKP